MRLLEDQLNRRNRLSYFLKVNDILNNKLDIVFDILCLSEANMPQRKDGTVVVEGVIRLWVTAKPARAAATS